MIGTFLLESIARLASPRVGGALFMDFLWSRSAAGLVRPEGQMLNTYSISECSFEFNSTWGGVWLIWSREDKVVQMGLTRVQCR
jgi:hypothetical protein